MEVVVVQAVASSGETYSSLTIGQRRQWGPGDSGRNRRLEAGIASRIALTTWRAGTTASRLP